MASQSEITLAQIRARANSQSFTRGEQYFRQNAISNTVKHGNIIEADCTGSRSRPYHIQATIDETGILSTSCTCQYSYEGDCKHIVALLLNYLKRPEDFEEHPPIEGTLQKRTKEELIKLIQTMVRHYPDLQALVDRPIPSTDSHLAPVNTTRFRKELRRTFESFGDYFDDHAATPIDVVDSITKSAEDFVDMGDWRSASAIYQAILDEFLDGNHEYLLDDEGELIESLNTAVEKLAACLGQSEILDSDTERRAIFTMLMRAFIWDTDYGGHGLADDAPDIVFKYAKPADIPIIRDQLLAAQADHIKQPYSSSWGQEVYSHVLMELDTLDHVDPEVILERLRENGQYYLLATKLLDLKRLDEALEVIKLHIQGNVDQTRVLYDLQQKGYEDAAIQQAEAWLNTAYNDFIAHWLIERLTINHDQERNLRWQLVRMNERPDIRYYVELKATAQALGNWDIMRPDLLKKLERGSHYDILIYAYLHDQDWDSAWAILPKIESKPPNRYQWMALDFEIAKQSYIARPEKALPVYQKHVRIRISERNRQSYAEAMALLKTVREIFKQLDDIVGWQQYISELRTEFRKLSAFQDELSKAKL
ncbi:MAG: hypothetical protein DPW16_18240 [Chloroflexi bacterium]|nr:hypothetical protein [Chloroflexota bacterium]